MEPAVGAHGGDPYPIRQLGQRLVQKLLEPRKVRRVSRAQPEVGDHLELGQDGEDRPVGGPAGLAGVVAFAGPLL